MGSINLDIRNPDLYANKYFQQIISNRDRYLLLYGGRDGAKSYSVAQKIVSDIWNEKYCKAVLVRQRHVDIKDSQYQTILDVIAQWGLNDYFDAIKSPLEIRCSNGNMIIARGLDNPKKMKSIKDPSIIWAEEADEISLEAFRDIDLSIRCPGKSLEQFIMTFNPSDEDIWLNNYFFPGRHTYERDDGKFHWIKPLKKSTTILHTTYLENKYCSKDRKKHHTDLKYIDAKYYKMALLGLWGSIDESIIFPEINYVDEFPSFEERKKYGIGMDFGFSKPIKFINKNC